MHLLDIVRRPSIPVPWQEGDNIPWNDPAFSRRMLAEHLSQEHDLASRKRPKILAHVDWLDETILGSRNSAILDLGCGPGLYCAELSRRGHTCVGLDYGPASIDYAKETASSEGLSATYRLGDMRTADFGGPYDLAMQLFGELNVFSPLDASTILSKAYSALRPGGTLLMEAHTLDAFTRDHEPRTWYSASGGLFAPGPYLVLNENYWDDATNQGTRRYFVVEPNSDDPAAAPTITAMAQSFQGYREHEYEELLLRHGFQNFRLLPGLAHDRLDTDPNFCLLVAQRPTE